MSGAAPSSAMARAQKVSVRTYETLVDVLGHRAFAAVVVGAFAFQAAWVSLSARLVIYDEEYHLLAVEAFSRHPTPFFEQTLADGELGDAERYGSWLYHYLMSFPWRVARGLGVGYDDRVLLLRLVTVLMVAASLVVFRRLFRELGATRAVANVAMLVVSVTPLLVFLAGAVSYDNMLMLMAALFFLSAVRLWRAETFDVGLWLSVIALGTFGSLTKYTFLPIVAFLGVVLIVRQVPHLRAIGRESRLYLADLDRVVLTRRVALVVVALLGLALFIERYIVNLVVYGAPVPACERVHEVEICEIYGPWARNVALDAAYPDASPSLSSMIGFATNLWVPLMLQYSTLIGVVDAANEPVSSTGPHVAGAILAFAVPAVLTVLLLAWGRLRAIPGVRLLLGAAAFYLLVLFGQNYLDYLTLGGAVGVAGRYALVVLPIAVGLACIGVAQVLAATSTTGVRSVKVLLLGVLVVGLTQGGGISSYLWAAQPGWLTDDSSAVGRITLWSGDVARGGILPNEVVRDPRF